MKSSQMLEGGQNSLEVPDVDNEKTWLSWISQWINTDDNIRSNENADFSILYIHYLIFSQQIPYPE